MIRLLYRLLLFLHPPAFRREFAGEMLWIFDETTGAAARAQLFSDALLSLARQWLLRSGAWKLLVAGAGGLVQIVFGGLIFGLFRQFHGSPPAALEPRAGSAELMRLVYITTWVTGGILSTVIALALWINNFTGRRIRHDA
jgi:hypothetical protein